MNKRLHTLLTVLAEIVVIVAIVAAIPKLLSWVLGTPYPLATITSSSMWPTLKRGDMVLIRGCPEDRLESGMIVVYRSPESDDMIIHRIEEIDGGEIVTKGDANEEADDPIAYADVVGVVANVGSKPVRVPYVGNLTMMFKPASVP